MRVPAHEVLGANSTAHVLVVGAHFAVVVDVLLLAVRTRSVPPSVLALSAFTM